MCGGLGDSRDRGYRRVCVWMGARKVRPSLVRRIIRMYPGGACGRGKRQRVFWGLALEDPLPKCPLFLPLWLSLLILLGGAVWGSPSVALTLCCVGLLSVQSSRRSYFLARR